MELFAKAPPPPSAIHPSVMLRSTHLKTTCRYQLPTLLNNLNSESEILKHVIANIETTTLLGLKRIMKNYFLDKYSYFCHILDCYICGLT